jgi:hypothetical protein
VVCHGKPSGSTTDYTKHGNRRCDAGHIARGHRTVCCLRERAEEGNSCGLW